MKFSELGIREKIRILPAAGFGIDLNTDPRARGLDSSVYIVGALGMIAALHVYRELSRNMTVWSVDSYQKRTSEVKSMINRLEDNTATYEGVRWAWEVNPVNWSGLLLFDQLNVYPATISRAVFSNFEGDDGFDEFVNREIYKLGRRINGYSRGSIDLVRTNVQPVLDSGVCGRLVITDILKNVGIRQRK